MSFERDPLTEGERALLERVGLPLEVPPPRRSDAAFSRAVRESAFARRRQKAPLALALAAALGLALALLVSGEPSPSERMTTPGVSTPEEIFSSSLEVLEEEAVQEALALDPLDDDSLLALESALDAKLSL